VNCGGVAYAVAFNEWKRDNHYSMQLMDELEAMVVGLMLLGCFVISCCRICTTVQADEESIAQAIEQSDVPKEGSVFFRGILLFEMTRFVVDPVLDFLLLFKLASLKHWMFCFTGSMFFVAGLVHQLEAGGVQRVIREAQRSWIAGRYTNGLRCIFYVEKSVEGIWNLVFAKILLIYTGEDQWALAWNNCLLYSSAYGVAKIIFELNDCGTDAELEQAMDENGNDQKAENQIEARDTISRLEIQLAEARSGREASEAECRQLRREMPGEGVTRQQRKKQTMPPLCCAAGV